MKEPLVVASHLLKAGEDTAIVFDFIEKALNHMALGIGKPIAFARLGTVGTRWDHRLHTPFFDRSQKPIAVVSLVRAQRFSTLRRERQQGFGLSDVALLSTAQDTVQWITQGVGERMRLGCEPTAGTSQSLLLGAAVGGTRGTRMGVHDRGIDENRL